MFEYTFVANNKRQRQGETNSQLTKIDEIIISVNAENEEQALISAKKAGVREFYELVYVKQL